MDIVERLRRGTITEWSNGWIEDETMEEAADEIELLREDVAELKDLLQATVNYTGVSVSNQKYSFHKQTHKWYLLKETKND